MSTSAEHDLLRIGQVLLTDANAGVVVTADDVPLRQVSARDFVWIEEPPDARRGVAATLGRIDTLRRLRRDAARTGGRVRLHRFPAGPAPRAAITKLARRWLRDGVVVEVSSNRHHLRILDEVLRSIEIRPSGPVRFGAGGTVLQLGRHAGGEPVVVRLGIADSAGDPRHAAATLHRLALLPRIPAPTLMDDGSRAGLAWSVEQRLPGRTVPALTAAMLGTVAALWSELPRTGGDPGVAARHHLTLVANAIPRVATTLTNLLEPVTGALELGPATLQHGDLWAGNLLWRGPRLTGVVDWSGQPDQDAPPGVDLLQLFASTWRRRVGEPLGSYWLRAPWEHPAFLALTSDADVPRGAGADERTYRWALGVAWWAREVAGTLERFPARKDDLSWIARNVDPVVDRLRISAAPTIETIGGNAR